MYINVNYNKNNGENICTDIAESIIAQ